MCEALPNLSDCPVYKATIRLEEPRRTRHLHSLEGDGKLSLHPKKGLFVVGAARFTKPSRRIPSITTSQMTCPGAGQVAFVSRDRNRSIYFYTWHRFPSSFPLNTSQLHHFEKSRVGRNRALIRHPLGRERCSRIPLARQATQHGSPRHFPWATRAVGPVETPTVVDLEPPTHPSFAGFVTTPTKQCFWLLIQVLRRCSLQCFCQSTGFGPRSNEMEGNQLRCKMLVESKAISVLTVTCHG